MFFAAENKRNFMISSTSFCRSFYHEKRGFRERLNDSQHRSPPRLALLARFFAIDEHVIGVGRAVVHLGPRVAEAVLVLAPLHGRISCFGREMTRLQRYRSRVKDRVMSVQRRRGIMLYFIGPTWTRKKQREQEERCEIKENKLLSRLPASVSMHRPQDFLQKRDI